ncbi:MAG: methyltransferase domain-containing protein [Bacteroidetes bacterium]|jgi:ubiquinone/menaquinone biosynthesis C-methylase UbiE|nr:methyltransferase domain-containing protein [Bacteroidota bacterium]
MIRDNNNAQFSNDNTLWEEVANTRWGAYTTDIARQAILKAHGLSKKPATALEIGVEGGRWSKLLADLGWNMVCTDINYEVLKTCKKRIPTANCILVGPNDNKIPYATDTVNLLLCVEVAPVIQSDWFINEAFRVLQNDGLIIGVFWNFLSFRGLFAHIKASFTGSFDFYKIAYRFWKRNLLNSGFCILYEEGYCWFPFSRASNSVFIPFFTRLEKRLGLGKLTDFSPWIVFIAQKKSKNT